MEQPRRLVAAELTKSFITKHGGAVTVENHLNMIRPSEGTRPHVAPRVIAALLNSHTVDQIFRCINGSTAVSAYELEAMPFPSPEQCAKLERLLTDGAPKPQIENAVKEMYSHVHVSAAA